MTLFSQVLPSTQKPALISSLIPSLRNVSVSLAALLLCLIALAQPARAAEYIVDDTTINYAIYDDIWVTSSATVDLVTGGSILWTLASFEESVVNVRGGSIGSDIAVVDYSTLNLYGGSIGDSGSFLSLLGPNTTLNVYGTGLRVEGPFYEYIHPHYVLSGTLSDGTPIRKRLALYDGADVSQIHLFNSDPFVALKAQVQALATSGTLSAGNTNALLTKLDAAQTAAAAGDIAGERDALTAFLNQVKALVRTGKLTAAQGAALLAGAQAILSNIR